MLALSTKLKAGALTLPLVTLLCHCVDLAFRALDLNGLDGFFGVIGIPILSGFSAPAKEAFNVFSRSLRGHFNMNPAGACVSLAGNRRNPNCGRPRHDVAIVRRRFGRHTRQPIGQRFRAEKPQC